MTHFSAILNVLFKYVNFATFVCFLKEKNKGFYNPFSKRNRLHLNFIVKICMKINVTN